MDNIIERSYWNNFYQNKDVGNIPSQFSVFVANECREIRTVIDVGCGNGRDTFFFGNLALDVLGVDASSSAIAACDHQLTLMPHLTRTNFLCADIADNDLFAKIEELFLKRAIAGPILVYSRFFLHAIDNEQEDLFINFCLILLKKYGGKIALEFRTKRDELQTKVTEHHYRRFIDPIQFFSKAQKKGLDVEYFSEGFGYAKFKSDDAHVARFILVNL